MSGTISTRTIETPRLRISARVGGPENAQALIFVHGNVSSSRFFEETMAQFADRYRVIAPDFRGYGETEAKEIDATRGVRDFSDDLHALIETLGLTKGGRKVHLVGWSVGGGVIQQYAIDHAENVASLVLLAPMSPYGFGGSKGLEGAPCFDDCAGSGGGTANPEFVKLIAAGERSGDNQFSPRAVMNAFYFKPPFRATPELEDAYVSSMLTTKVGDGFYPGDMTSSSNWPTLAPGTKGMNNALSPKYVNLSAFANISPRPPVLWIRGADDQIVSDTSLFDFGFLGSLGAVPGWPGNDVFPPQPMVSQVRAVLDAYKAKGGEYREEVFENTGHGPHIEQPERFVRLVKGFLADRS